MELKEQNKRVTTVICSCTSDNNTTNEYKYPIFHGRTTRYMWSYHKLNRLHIEFMFSMNYIGPASLFTIIHEYWGSNYFHRRGRAVMNHLIDAGVIDMRVVGGGYSYSLNESGVMMLAEYSKIYEGLEKKSKFYKS